MCAEMLPMLLGPKIVALNTIVVMFYVGSTNSLCDVMKLWGMWLIRKD